MAKKLEPLPCPFCGMNPKVFKITEYVDPPFWKVACLSDERFKRFGIKQPFIHTIVSVSGLKRSDAIKMWNRRA